MFPHPTLQHKANRNAIDRVTAAKAKTVVRGLREGAETLMKARANVDIKWNPRTGGPAFIHGNLSPRISGSPSDIAQACLADLSEPLGITRDLSNLVEIDRFEWAGFQHVRFQQTYEGIPVYGAELLVAIDPNDEVKTVTSDVDPALTLPAEKTVISKREAIQTALADLGDRVRLDGRIVSEVVLYPTLNGYARCYHLLIPAAEPLGDWRYFIDVENGNIVDSANVMCFYHAGRGFVYLQNPEDTPQSTGMLRNLKAPYNKLDGTYVKVENEDGPEAIAAPGLKFYYTPDTDTHFDEVNCYHAVDKVYRYFRDLGFRGFTVNNPYGKAATPKGQIRANVHEGTKFDNAFYRPATGEIHFGDGSHPTNPSGLRDLAKESDVIFHEFGHAVIDELRRGIGGTDGAALHEAYADYFACSFTNPPEPELGEYVRPGPGMIRNLNNTNKYPGAPAQPHTRGLVWGGACWDLRKKVGGEVADYLIFGSLLFITTTAPTFKYAKDQLLFVDATYAGGEYTPIIKDIFETQRGIPV